MAESVPVVLIVFNRPDLAEQAVTRLGRHRPARLLVVADGPRDAAEVALCERSRDAVRHGVTWPCEIEWEVSERNLGCAERVSTGLDWAFERAESAIVLEDDIEVHDSFFAFATAALDEHRHDPAIGAVSARNELVAFPGDGSSVRVRRCGIWGWATWADRWQAYRSTPPVGRPPLPADDPSLLVRLHRHFEASMQVRLAGVWDVMWTRWLIATGRRVIMPGTNLSANHGFRADGTHTTAEGDFRGMFPLAPEPADPAAAAALVDLAGGDAATAHDELATLLDIMALHGHPRRWRLMATHAERSAPLPEGLDIMLEPWRRREQARATLDYVAARVTSEQIAALREALA